MCCDMFWIVRVFLFWQAMTAFAEDLGSFIPSGGGACKLGEGEIKADCIPKFIGEVIRMIFSFTGGIFLVLILFSGYQMMLGKAMGGDKSAGMTTLRYAVIGFIVSALSFFIIDFVISTLAG